MAVDHVRENQQYGLFNVGSSFTLLRVFSQEADSALILPPSFHQYSVLTVFKATRISLTDRRLVLNRRKEVYFIAVISLSSIISH